MSELRAVYEFYWDVQDTARISIKKITDGNLNVTGIERKSKTNKLYKDVVRTSELI